MTRPRTGLLAALAAALVAAGLPAAAAVRPGAAVVQRAPRLASFDGEGFDHCIASDTGTMKAWLASPYRAVNFYIPTAEGLASACKTQSELTAQWVSTVTANGWSLIPTYVGLQAPCRSGAPNRIDSSPLTAYNQGSAAADNAIEFLQGIGIGPPNPVYDDLEPFSATNQSCDSAVQAFVGGWDAELSAKGWTPGIYTIGTPQNPDVAIVTDANPAPKDVWWAAYDGVDSVNDQAELSSSAYAGHRIHQYVGGVTETYNTESINIDRDRVAADVVGSVTPTVPAGPPYLYAAAPPAGGHLNARSAPTTSAGNNVVATYAYGAPLSIACQAVGQSEDGTIVWDQLSDGSYVTDSYVTTTGGLSFTPGLPRCDTTPPSTPALTPLPAATLASTRTLGWTAATDAASGIAHYDVRYRRAAWNSGFGHWHTFASPAATSVAVPLPAGRVSCFDVRAVDRSGNAGAWSAPVCTSRAADDRSLTASSGWSRRTGSHFYLGTVTEAHRGGATLQARGAQLDAIGIVATRCGTCGRVRVYVGGRLVATISLHAASRQRRWRSPLYPVAATTATVRVVTASARDVQLDGFIVTR